MTISVNSDPYSAVFVILASIASALVAIVAFICCCHGSSNTQRRPKKRKTSEEREEAVGDGNAAAIVAADTVGRKASVLSDQQPSHCVAGDESSSSLRSSAGCVEQQPDGNANRSLANNDLTALTSGTQTSTKEARDSNDKSEDGISDYEQTPGDFSTIRKAGVNVKLAMAAYETGQVSQSATAEKSVLRVPRKKLDPALKDLIVIKPGRPPMQRHTVGADMFNAMEEQSGAVVEADAEEELRKQEVKRILPDLLVATPKRTSGKSRMRPEDALTNNDMRSSAEGDRKSSGSRNSEAESDYFGAIQRQDAVLRSVEKARAPHKHKKGKVPTTYIEDSEGMKHSRPHSSGDILDSVSER